MHFGNANMSNYLQVTILIKFENFFRAFYSPDYYNFDGLTLTIISRLFHVSLNFKKTYKYQTMFDI